MSKECLDNLIYELGRQRADIGEAKEYILYYKNMLKDAEEELERIIKEILEIQKDILEEEKNVKSSK